MNKETYINKAIAKFGLMYDYSLLPDQINLKTKIVITCSTHGQFCKIAGDHIRVNRNGGGCPKCAIDKTRSTEFITEAKKIHGDKYDYSLVQYLNKKTPVSIICPTHGVFEQRPGDHLRGNGCAKCIKPVHDTESFIHTSQLVHKDKYDYSLVEYKHTFGKVNIVCPIHGVFNQTPASHITGRGCPKCGVEAGGYTAQEYIEKARAKHNNYYDYSLTKYTSHKDKIEVCCPKHGVFNVTAKQHLSGSGCPKCRFEKQSERNKKTREEFIQEASKLHNNKYSYEETEYQTCFDKVKVTCPIHGVFEQRPADHLNKSSGCPKCKHIRSTKEIELYDFVTKELNLEVTDNDKKVIYPKTLDIFIPSLNLGMEFNGLLHHSELRKDNRYHYNKTKICNNNGVRLLHVWEDDWIQKEPIVKSIIRNLTNKIKTRIFARKCSLQLVDSKTACEFYNNNHIQGGAYFKVNVGLWYNNELVSCMSFTTNASNRGNTTQWELIRFANLINTNVLGASSKLFKWFINNYSPDSVISFSNNDYFSGSMYKLLGFELVNELQPDYKTIYKKQRKPKQFTKKENLKKLFPDCDLTKTEHEICLEHQLYRIYDAGKKKWSYSK